MIVKPTIEVNGATDKGRVRSSNQDFYLIDTNEQLYIVADGMGGHAGGEIASRMCVSEVSAYLKKHLEVFAAKIHPDPKILSVLSEAINFASTKIYEKALEEPHLKGMGTTTTLLKIVDRHAYCAHVGDSRLYLVRSGLIYKITHDHSLVYEQVRAGLLSQEEAELHHLRNVITRSVGYQEEEDVDSLSVVLEVGDTLLLCSDGLYGKVSDRELSLACQENGVGAVTPLIMLANERGGDDNITVIILRLVSLP